jgi:hypothetical protein
MSDEPDAPNYDFARLGEKIADVLLRTGDDLANEAANLQEKAKVLADGIRAMVAEHDKAIEDFKGRLKVFGGEVLDAHKKFINGGKHENPSP